MRRLSYAQPQGREAAGYIRVSRKVQADGHSPDTQREQIKRLAAQEGYALTLIEEDHERGSVITRQGYQRIIDGVRAGTVHAVLVFCFDRWGRDGAEWLTRAAEFERLGVPIISAQEGRDEGGIIRFVRAGMAEEFSRGLAKKVTPNRVRGAQEGTHMGPTPFGYRRVYPQPLANGRRPPAALVIDEAEAYIVRELYRRYAAGNTVQRALANWLNEQQIPKRRSGPWTVGSVYAILHNPVYIGRVRYNRRPQGKYERAAPDSEFTAPGNHEAIIDEATWQEVQRRMHAAAMSTAANRSTTASGRPTFLGTGILRCADCNNPMRTHYSISYMLHSDYSCDGRYSGRADCREPAYSRVPADRALLDQARRLQGAPWTPQAELRILGTADDDQGVRIASQQRELESERERLRRHTRLMSMMEDDPTPEQIVAFRDLSAEISGRIRMLEAGLAGVSKRAARLPDLRDLHTQLARTEIAALIDDLVAIDDVQGLRDLLLPLIASARVVERYPAKSVAWVRIAVEWTEDVQMLLGAGLLTLGPEPELSETFKEEVRVRRVQRATHAAQSRWGPRRQAVEA